MKVSSYLALSVLSALSIASMPIRTSALPAVTTVSANVETQPETGVGSDRPQNEALTSEEEVPALSSAFSQVLLGHWVTNGGQTHYFFSENKVTVVNVLQDQVPIQPAWTTLPETQDVPNSPQIYRQIMSYEVSFVNESNNMMYVRINTPLAWAEGRWLRFSSDRQNVVETINILGHELSTEWTYVSDQQVPPTVLSYDFPR